MFITGTPILVLNLWCKLKLFRNKFNSTVKGLLHKQMELVLRLETRLVQIHLNFSLHICKTKLFHETVWFCLTLKLQVFFETSPLFFPFLKSSVVQGFHIAHSPAQRPPPFSFLAAVLIPSAAKIRQAGRENYNTFNYKQLYFNFRRQKLPLSDRCNKKKNLL